MVCIGIVVSCSCKDVVSQNHTLDLCRQLVFWRYIVRALIRNQLSWRINADVCIDHGTFLINTFFIDKTAFAGPVTSTKYIVLLVMFFSKRKFKPLAWKKICTLRNENMSKEKMSHWWITIPLKYFKTYNLTVHYITWTWRQVCLFKISRDISSCILWVLKTSVSAGWFHC